MPEEYHKIVELINDRYERLMEGHPPPNGYRDTLEAERVALLNYLAQLSEPRCDWDCDTCRA